MSTTTGIAWTDHTFNPWWGCVKVSPACDSCYAERDAHRYGFAEGGGNGPELWGKGTERRRLSDAHWRKPLAWNEAARAAGRPALVFCASMADVFEARDDLDPERARLWELIEATPWLRWQLLTKRPEQVRRRVPARWLDEPGNLRCDRCGASASLPLGMSCPDHRPSATGWPPHVWVGTTVEDQQRADLRIPRLLEIPAPVRFLSIEPMLGPVDLAPWIDRHPENYADQVRGVPVTYSSPIGWVIVGGESGPGHRPFDLVAARDVVLMADLGGVPVFFKQVSGSRSGIPGPPDLEAHKAFPPEAGDRSPASPPEVAEQVQT